MKGSLTVEASYIFPFCFVMIGIVCYLGIFLYNQAVLKMTGYECILQVMEERDTEDTAFQENLLHQAEQSAKKRALAVKDLKAAVKVTASKISLTYNGMQTMLKIPLEATVVYERTFPELTLRLTRLKTGE